MREEDEWDGGVLGELAPEWADRVVFFEECGSTNDEAMRLGRLGADHFTLVLTERQVAGRGRRGSGWVSPLGEAIACSLILKPEVDSVLWSRFALSAGLAVAEGLESFGVSTEVKWPNDVLVRGKKICGILVEKRDDLVVIGIGVNVNVREFPEELNGVASSLLLESGKRWRREEVLAKILVKLKMRAGQVGGEFEQVKIAWEERCALRGEMVEMRVGGELKSGVVLGLSSGGGLLLEGGEEIIQADLVRRC